MAEVLSYEDKKYEQSKSIYDVVAQCVEDIKYGTVQGGHAWNIPLTELNGLTVKFVGTENLEITHHRCELGTAEDIERDGINENGEKFLKEVVKQIKKTFKSRTGKALKLKEVESDRSLEKTSRLQPETSWQLGYKRPPVDKYLIRNSCLYEFSANL